MINNRIVLIPVQSTQSRSASTTFLTITSGLTAHLARVLITQTRQTPPYVCRADNVWAAKPARLTYA
jgi:hypothetical protein